MLTPKPIISIRPIMLKLAVVLTTMPKPAVPKPTRAVTIKPTRLKLSNILAITKPITPKLTNINKLTMPKHTTKPALLKPTTTKKQQVSN